MFLRRKFADPQVNLALELFLRIIADVFGEQLVSVVLYGSIVFDDLAPGYGDLDFLAVAKGDLSQDECQRLVELRKPLCSGRYGAVVSMIEGAFLPQHMLDPASAGTALWWGTSGERMWTRSELGWLVLHTIRERGVVAWGEDVRNCIPRASRNMLLQDVQSACDSMKAHGRGGTLHSVDWLLTAARLLLWLREGRLSSKSEAAEWGYVHARGAWRQFLPRARQMRLDPALANTPEARLWLDALTAPIQEASTELEQELMVQGCLGGE
jgi:predicted nucleotidyltransferase